jgi:hypothetical protein
MTKPARSPSSPSRSLRQLSETELARSRGGATTLATVVSPRPSAPSPVPIPYPNIG